MFVQGLIVYGTNLSKKSLDILHTVVHLQDKKKFLESAFPDALQIVLSVEQSSVTPERSTAQSYDLNETKNSSSDIRLSSSDLNVSAEVTLNDSQSSVSSQRSELEADCDDLGSLRSSMPKMSVVSVGETLIREIDPSMLHDRGLLGRGAYSEVRKMSWMGQIVAVKFVEEATRNDDLAETTRYEAALMMQLQHPSIAASYGILRGQCAIVMEFLSKGSLHDFLKSDSTLDDAGKIQMCLEISSGVWFLHENNVVHRDIKSGNVMLTGDLHCKIIDFGLSQLKHSLDTLGISSIKSGSSIVGSLLWMAPEIVTVDLNSDGIPYNKSTDIYALGITMWEIAARKIPYSSVNSNPGIVVACKAQGKHDKIPADTPPRLAKAIELCRSNIPSQRPSAIQLLEILNDQ